MRCRSLLQITLLQISGLGGSGTAYSNALHIPVPRAGATPLSLKAHPLCLQYAELESHHPGEERGLGRGLGPGTWTRES